MDYREETKQQSLLEAIGLLRSKDHSAVEAEVGAVIRSFLFFKGNEDESPRPIEARTKLANLKNRARKLREAIEGIDYITADLLLWQEMAFDREKDIPEGTERQALLSKADLWGEEMHKLGREPLLPDLAPEPLNWVTKLSALESLAESALAVTPVDRGGKAKLSKRSFGPAKLRLAFDCFEVFDRYRPGEARASEGGDFHLFLEAVFRAATGEEAKGMSNEAKNVLSLVREIRDIEGEVKDVETKLNVSTNAQERQSLRRDLQALYDQLDERFRGVRDEG